MQEEQKIEVLKNLRCAHVLAEQGLYRQASRYLRRVESINFVHPIDSRQGKRELSVWCRRVSATLAEADLISGSRWSLFRRSCAVAAGVFLCLWLAARFVHQEYLETLTPRVDLPQDHYKNIGEIDGLGSAKPIYWAELGRDGAVFSILVAHRDVKGRIAGCQLSPEKWPREVYWHIFCEESANIKLNFPKGGASHVAFFLTDGDSFSRLSRIEVEGSYKLANDLHNGRWISLPISEREREQGSVEVRLFKLNGNNIAISALALFNASKK